MRAGTGSAMAAASTTGPSRRLRARRPLLALGLAYAGQELPEVPDGDHDMRLDGIVTEAGVRWLAG